MFKVVVAIALGLSILWIGLIVLRTLARGQPEPPPAGELRKVKIGYRCSICGAELRMTVAPHEDPDPPRHCQEEMDLLAPID